MSNYRLTNNKIIQIVKNWQIIADKYCGDFKNIKNKSSAVLDPYQTQHKRFELLIPYGKESNIVLKTSEQHPFKIQYSFKKRINFEFQIYPEDYMDKITKIFGMQDIIVGNDLIDKRYIVKSNIPDAIKRLLRGDIGQHLINQNILSMQLAKSKNSQLLIFPYSVEHNLNILDQLVKTSTDIVDYIYKVK